jgi:signal transduction histidine kinase
VILQAAVQLAMQGEISYDSPMVWLPATNASIALSGALFALVAARLKISYDAMEMCAMLTLCSVGALIQLPERLTDALDGELALDSTIFAMRYAFILVYCGIYTPLRPPLFAAFCVIIFSMSAILEMQLSIKQDPLTVLLTAVLTLLVGFGRRHIMSIERSTWYFHRTVQAAVIANHAKERDRMAKALALTEASIAKEARSRLIRIGAHGRPRVLVRPPVRQAVRALAPLPHTLWPPLALFPSISVMHDLRSPLLAVRNVSDGLSGWLGELVRQDDRVSTGLTVLQTCSAMMETIISDMLDFERIGSGRMAIVRSGSTLLPVLEQATQTFQGSAKTKGIELRVLPVPPLLAQLELHADFTRLRQCLHNGISNAIKFTDSGGRVNVRAWAEPHSPGAWSVSIAVEDTGVGVVSSELQLLRYGKVFESVTKGQLQGQGGTGLGLAISREILKLHSGQLSIYSAGPGRGTTFKMVVNLYAQQEMERAKVEGRVLESLPIPPVESFSESRRSFSAQAVSFAKRSDAAASPVDPSSLSLVPSPVPLGPEAGLVRAITPGDRLEQVIPGVLDRGVSAQLTHAAVGTASAHEVGIRRVITPQAEVSAQSAVAPSHSVDSDCEPMDTDPLGGQAARVIEPSKGNLRVMQLRPIGHGGLSAPLSALISAGGQYSKPRILHVEVRPRTRAMGSPRWRALRCLSLPSPRTYADAPSTVRSGLARALTRTPRPPSALSWPRDLPRVIPLSIPNPRPGRLSHSPGRHVPSSYLATGHVCAGRRRL